MLEIELFPGERSNLGILVLDRTVELIDRLDGLSAREKEMIMGDNAVRIYELAL